MKIGKWREMSWGEMIFGERRRKEKYRGEKRHLGKIGENSSQINLSNLT